MLTSVRLSRTPDITEKVESPALKEYRRKLKVSELISTLLNKRSSLSVEYNAQKVMNNFSQYRYFMDGDELIACVQFKKVQWYQYEVLHLVVAQEYIGQGYAMKILDLIEGEARQYGARVLQCTIRKDNVASMNLFLGKGFVVTCQYYNRATGNWVNILQKVLSDSIEEQE